MWWVQLAQQFAAPLTDGQGPDISRFDRIRGNPGVVTTGMFGLVFCVFFVLLKRNLWVLILAHGLMHLMSFTAVYFGLA